MFDGAGAVTAAKTAADSAAAHTLTVPQAQALAAVLAANVPPAVEARAADPSLDGGKKEVAFVDTSVADYQTLVAGLRPGIAVELIGGGTGGLAQMAQWAESHSDFDAIHLVSHGGEGELQIGTDVVTDANLSETAVQAELLTIATALKPGGDLLLYGCDVAKGADGQAFIHDLALQTGADIAASTDVTGAAALGGNWELEASTGAIGVAALDLPGYADTLPLSFASATTYATGDSPTGVAFGDFNGDGNTDLAVANYSGGTVSVLLGNDDGTLQAKTDYTTGSGASFAVVGDLNGDGKLDLAVVNNGDSTISVLLGNGDGTFQAKADYATGDTPYTVALGDLNGDGKLDLAVANFASNSISVLLGNGDGTFRAKTDYTTLSPPYSVALGDLNGDGKLDLVVAYPYGGAASVSLGNGDGTFQAMAYYDTGSVPYSVTIGDLNGDGKLDLVAASGLFNAVSVLLGNGDGTFQDKTTYATGRTPYYAVIGDINGDGRPDLAVANHGDSTVSVLLGNGDGTFQARVDYATGATPYFVALADVNGDGKPDMVVTNLGDSTVSVFLNTTPSAPSVSAINRHTGAAATNNATTEVFDVAFSAAVTGVAAGKFSLSGSGVTGTIASVTDSGDHINYTVTVTGVAGNGTLGLDLSDMTGITAVSGGAALTATHTSDQTYTVDHIVPTVTGVTSSTANGTYKTGNTVSIQVGFSEAVTVTGTPQLTLNSAAGGRVVNYASGSSTSTLTFTYTVQAGDGSADLDFTSTSALALNGATIRDAAGNDATRTLATPGDGGSLGGSKNIVIDAAAPTYGTIARADMTAPSGTSAIFTVTYDGTFSVIDGTTIDPTNVTVKDTGGNALAVTLASWNAGTSTATYTFTPPGGSWDAGDAGAYTIGINTTGVTVSDVMGNTIAAVASAKTFHVNFGSIAPDPSPTPHPPPPQMQPPATVSPSSVSSGVSSPAISVGTVGATDTGAGASGGRLITSSAMNGGSVDTGAGNSGGRLITSSSMNSPASGSMISNASSFGSGAGGGSGLGSGNGLGATFSDQLSGGTGFGTFSTMFSSSSNGTGMGGFSMGSRPAGSGSTGDAPSTGGTGTANGPSISGGASTSGEPPASGDSNGGASSRSTNGQTRDGEAQGREQQSSPRGPQGQERQQEQHRNQQQPKEGGQQEPQGERGQPTQGGDRSGPAAPSGAQPHAYLFGPATRSFTDQLADAAGAFEHNRAALLDAVKAATSRIDRHAA